MGRDQNEFDGQAKGAGPWVVAVEAGISERTEWDFVEGGNGRGLCSVGWS